MGNRKKDQHWLNILKEIRNLDGTNIFISEIKNTGTEKNIKQEVSGMIKTLTKYNTLLKAWNRDGNNRE